MESKTSRRHCHQDLDLYFVDSKSGIRRAALNSRIEKRKVFVDKKSRITAGGLASANSAHAINHVDSTLN